VVIAVSADSTTRAAHERHPAPALERHLTSARDVATAGEIESAIDSLRDRMPPCTELRSVSAHARLSARPGPKR
jgi:hypothetical protein